MLKVYINVIFFMTSKSLLIEYYISMLCKDINEAGDTVKGKEMN